MECCYSGARTLTRWLYGSDEEMSGSNTNWPVHYHISQVTLGVQHVERQPYYQQHGEEPNNTDQGLYPEPLSWTPSPTMFRPRCPGPSLSVLYSRGRSTCAQADSHAHDRRTRSLNFGRSSTHPYRTGSRCPGRWFGAGTSHDNDTPTHRQHRAARRNTSRCPTGRGSVS